jgi:hypothetical protein
LLRLRKTLEKMDKCVLSNRVHCVYHNLEEEEEEKNEEKKKKWYLGGKSGIVATGKGNCFTMKVLQLEMEIVSP